MLKRLPRSVFALVVLVALMAVSTRFVSADPRNFTVINESSIVITHVYVGASDDPDPWAASDDILGRDVLNPGEQWDVYFDKYDGEAGKCFYDILAVGINGEQSALRAVDLCSTYTVTFYDA